MKLTCQNCMLTFEVDEQGDQVLEYQQSCRQVFVLRPAGVATCPRCEFPQPMAPEAGSDFDAGADTEMIKPRELESMLSRDRRKAGTASPQPQQRPKKTSKPRIDINQMIESAVRPLPAAPPRRALSTAEDKATPNPTPPNRIDPFRDDAASLFSEAPLKPLQREASEVSERSYGKLIAMTLVASIGIGIAYQQIVLMHGAAPRSAYVTEAALVPGGESGHDLATQRAMALQESADLHDHDANDIATQAELQRLLSEDQNGDSWLEFVARKAGSAEQHSNLLPSSAYLSSPFGYRVDPFSKKWRFHYGLDIAMRQGAQIKALLPGKVSYAGYHRQYGNVVIVEHPHGLKTIYGHNSKLLVQTADIIDRHQTVALAGMSGRATGPHLHFEVRLNDRAIDPTMVPQFRFLTKNGR